MKLPERKGTVKPKWADNLEQGLEKLWDGVSDSAGKKSWICYTVYYDNSLCDEIARRIQPFVYFNSWYRDNNEGDFSIVEIQAARKAWMLDMIEEFRGPCKSSS